MSVFYENSDIQTGSLHESRCWSRSNITHDVSGTTPTGVGNVLHHIGMTGDDGDGCGNDPGKTLIMIFFFFRFCKCAIETG